MLRLRLFRRKMFSPKTSFEHFFSGVKLAYENIFQNECRESTTVNLGQLLNMCTTNAIAHVMLGRRVFGDEFKSMLVELMVLAEVFKIGNFVPSLEWLDLQGVAKKMKKLHVRFNVFLREIHEEHKVGVHRGAQSHTDLLSKLVSLKENADGEGGKLTDTGTGRGKWKMTYGEFWDKTFYPNLG